MFKISFSVFKINFDHTYILTQYNILYMSHETTTHTFTLSHMYAYIGTPFTPLLQLLSVLPPQSGSFLPPSYMDVMTDPMSPCVDYYPKDFEVDANGKKVSNSRS
jgi:5'-3' exonuclease